VQLDVLFGIQAVTPADVTGRVVAVIDVLRATTSMTVALANGARAVVPFESSEEVVSRAKALSRQDVVLAGERRMLAIPGFGQKSLEEVKVRLHERNFLLRDEAPAGLEELAGATEVSAEGDGYEEDYEAEPAERQSGYASESEESET
jgi:uncharacterized protein YlzI (FlbEa/FlbD family)